MLTNDFSGFGAASCSSFTTKLGQIKAALAKAKAAGVDSSSNAYGAAQVFYDRQTGFFTKPTPELLAVPENCATLTRTADTLLSSLNSALSSGRIATAPKAPATGGTAPVWTFPEETIIAGRVSPLVALAVLGAIAFTFAG